VTVGRGDGGGGGGGYQLLLTLPFHIGVVDDDAVRAVERSVTGKSIAIQLQ